MAVAVANAKDEHGEPLFNVVGVDLPTKAGNDRVNAINNGQFPFSVVDVKLIKALKESNQIGNLIATTDRNIFKSANVTLVSINLDINKYNENQTIKLDSFKNAICTLGELMPEDSLIIVETTVPPGTCEKIIAPLLANTIAKRNLTPSSILLAYSYERVMPGRNYLDSITNYWRVYAGYNKEAADRCEDFLSKVIDVKKYPLTRLHSTTASEIAKVLENSYRATNIAFMEEWGRFAEDIGIDLLEVIDAIRMRPTHSNLRQPGFGVGGYCLTKDPLMARLAAREIFKLHGHDFPFSSKAVEVNDKMPLVSFEKIKLKFGGSLAGKKILLLGISYRQDLADTRYSPSEIFFRKAKSQGANIVPHDPLVDYWEELNIKVENRLPEDASDFDIILFTVPHENYKHINFNKWISSKKPLIFDANNVLTSTQRKNIIDLGCKLYSIGRGELN